MMMRSKAWVYGVSILWVCGLCVLSVSATAAATPTLASHPAPRKNTHSVSGLGAAEGSRAGSLGGSKVGVVGGGGVKGGHDRMAAKLMANLISAGYKVELGSYAFFTQDDCDRLPSCYGDNPANPYGLVFLPRWSKDNDPAFCEILCSADGSKSASWKLEPNQTVVMVGDTPPQSKYMSFTSYVVSRWYPHGWTSPSSDLMGKCPKVKDPNGSRCPVFASIHDAVNHLTVNTTDTEGTSSSPFDSQFVGLIGADQGQRDVVAAASVASGLQPQAVNTFPIPASDTRLCTDRPSCDTFGSMLRVAFPQNSTAWQQYMRNPPLTVFRVTPPSTAKAEPRPYPHPRLRPRGTTPEQAAWSGASPGELKAALSQSLAAGVTRQHLQSYPYMRKFTLQPPTFNNGFDCLKEGKQCNGDVGDTLYPNSRSNVLQHELCTKLLRGKCSSPQRASMGDDDFFLITGVNHNATGKALYSTVTMYNFDRLESTSGTFDLAGREAVGSALPYLQPTDQKFSPYLYAVKLARSCDPGDGTCKAIASSGPNSLPKDTPAVFIERLYLDPMYNSGPTSDSSIKPIIYHFSKSRFRAQSQSSDSTDDLATPMSVQPRRYPWSCAWATVGMGLAVVALVVMAKRNRGRVRGRCTSESTQDAKVVA